MIEVKWKYQNRLENLVKNIEDINKQTVDIGFFKQQGTHPESGNLTYPELMAIHELREKGDPLRRPVFEVSVQKRGKKFQKEATDIFKSYVDKWATGRRLSPKTLLGEIGESGIKMVKPTFGDIGLLKPNTEGVAKSKGKNTPMVDFGYLKEALAYKTSKRKSIKKFN